MPCNVQIRAINGLVHSGQSNPTQLRVTGRAQQCGSGQVKITSTITAPTTVALLGDDFVATLPIIGIVQCGDSINVRVECTSDPTNCFDQLQNFSLPCCVPRIVSVTGDVPIGGLDPVNIIVSGTLLGCISNQVVVGSTVTATSPPTPVDPVTGSFVVTLRVTTPVKCDDSITVTAECFWPTPPLPPTPGCLDTYNKPLDCPGCARAQVSYTAAPCTGTPATQPITLNAIISIPAGSIRTFRWVYGDGATGVPFTVDNTAGTAATQYPVTEPPHAYAPGPYTARLVVVPPPSECPPFPRPLVAQCVPSCPSGNIVVADPGECANGKRTVTFNATVTAPSATAAIGQWNLGYTPAGGAPLGKLFVVPAGATQNQTANANLQQTWTYPPGTYTVFLDVSAAHPGCPNPSLTFTVADCPITCEVLLDYAPKPLPCLPPGGSITVNFVATLNPPNPAYTGPFTWEVTKGGVLLKKVTQNAPTVVNPHTFSHPFTAPGAYDVTVTIATPGCDDPTDTATASPQVVIKSCCPTITSFTGQQISPCTWSFAVQVDNPTSAALTYQWTFHDGTTASTTVPGITHTYPIGGITTGQTNVIVKSAGCPDVTASPPVTVTVMCFCPTVGTPTAAVTGCAPGGTPAVALSTTVSGAAATSFAWTATDPSGTTFTKTTTLPTTTDGTADGVWTNTSNGSTGALPLPAGSYAVTVRASGPAIDPQCSSVSAPFSFTVPTCPSTTPPPSSSLGCDVLLVIAVVLLILGSIVVTIGVCIGVPWVWIAGAIVGAVGLILFILWAIFCAAFTSCSLMRTIHCILFWMVAVAGPILGLLAWIFGGLPCLLAELGAWAGWGTLYAWLGAAMRAVGCAPTC